MLARFQSVLEEHDRDNSYDGRVAPFRFEFMLCMMKLMALADRVLERARSETSVSEQQRYFFAVTDLGLHLRGIQDILRALRSAEFNQDQTQDLIEKFLRIIPMTGAPDTIDTILRFNENADYIGRFHSVQNVVISFLLEYDTLSLDRIEDILGQIRVHVSC